MKKSRTRFLDMVIDKLTNSIENISTGEVFDTEIVRIGLIREPKNVDFTGQSKPWTEKELRDFRNLMARLKKKNASKKGSLVPQRRKRY